jgi:hypothetical protein
MTHPEAPDETRCPCGYDLAACKPYDANACLYGPAIAAPPAGSRERDHDPRLWRLHP